MVRGLGLQEEGQIAGFNRGDKVSLIKSVTLEERFAGELVR